MTDKDEQESVYVRHFHPGLCARCFKVPSKTNTNRNCSRCQLVSYCSKECQKLDWKVHKPFCCVNETQDGKNIFSDAAKTAKTKEDWVKFRTSLQIATHVNLKRPLQTFEREILWSPKVCEICRDSDISKLIPCPLCYSTFYCSSEHLSEDIDNHVNWCGRYHTCATVDGFEYSRGPDADLPLPINISKDYSVLPKDMSVFLCNELSFPIATPEARILFNILVSERVTDPLTLLQVLEYFYIGKMKQRINSVSELTVHVVGAECMREMLGIIRWEFLAHRIPSLKMLRVVFIGPKIFPESEEIPDNYIFSSDDMPACDDCQKSERKFVYEMCQMLYHEYTEKNYYCAPDVIVAFNCGFHEFVGLEQDTWPESIKLMVSDPSIPLVFTSYTELEASKDLQVVLNTKDIHISRPTEVNPYRSLRPFRDFFRDDDTPIFYINQYITCVNGQKI